jgi:hypothetical protein
VTTRRNAEVVDFPSELQCTIKFGIEIEVDVLVSEVMGRNPRQVAKDNGIKPTSTMTVRIDGRKHSMDDAISAFPSIIEYDDDQKDRGNEEE